MKKIEDLSDLAINGRSPLFDELRHVGRPNVGSRRDFYKIVDQIFDRVWLTNDGPVVQELEASLAEHLGVSNCVLVANGTLGLEIAARALGMTSGEVIVPSYTFVATAHAVRFQGLDPIFADISRTTHNIDPIEVEKLITDSTVGIIGVHLWGRPAATAELEEIAKAHGIPLLFDAAHAFSCSDSGGMIGNYGSAEVFSFHATKFFNTFEGGAVATNDAALADEIRLLRNFGFAGVDNVTSVGTNAKMTEVCAAMGLVNLAEVPRLIESNFKIYETYREIFTANPGVNLIEFDESNQNNFQYMVLECHDRMQRDHLHDVLQRENVAARKYFWPGTHRMAAYRTSPLRRDLPETERISDRVLVLPSGSAVSVDEATAIAKIVEIASEN